MNNAIDKVNRFWNNQFNDMDNMFQNSRDWGLFMYSNNKQKK